MNSYQQIIERAKTHWQEHDADTAALVNVADELYVKWIRRVLAKQAIERVLHELWEMQDVEELRSALREIWRLNAQE